jgi:phenylacetate-coenzyme A ligase PaaK-like adenylate-forming protein
MRWDREPTAARHKQQDRMLRNYLVHEVYPYSTFYRARFDAAGKQPKALKSLADIASLPLTSWDEVAASPFEVVLRPDEESIAHYGNRRLVLAVTRAKLRGGSGEVNRDVIDRAFKPIHWHLDEGVPVGYTFEDLERLAEAGHRVLAVAGMSRYDVLVTVTAPGPSLAYWQLVYGARAAGVSALHVGHEVDPALVVAAAPTVLAGSSSELLALLTDLEDDGRKLPDLHLLLVVGELIDDTTRDLLRASGRAVGKRDLDVVAAWAPPGVRALWAQCRGGAGFHTYPDLEWVEVVDPAGRPVQDRGELVWTAVNWRGSALIRLRTGVVAAARDETCPTCQRIGVRLITAGDVAPEPEREPEEAVAWLKETEAGAEPAAEPEPQAAPALRQSWPAERPAAIVATAGSDDDEDEDEYDEEEEEAVAVAVGVGAPATAGDEYDEDEDDYDEEEEEEEEVAGPVTIAGAVHATPGALAAGLPEELEVLREHAGIAAWQAEYRWVGDDEELLVFLAPANSGHPGPLCREIDRTLQATQYVVLGRDAVEARIARDGLVVDLRD